MNATQPEITAVSIPFVMAVSIGFFLSIILFFSLKGNTKANKYLSLLILSFALLEIWDFLIQTHLIIKFPNLLMVFNPLLFILGPLVFLYIKAMTSIGWKFERKHIIHFIPVILSYIFSIPVYVLNEHERIRLIANAFLNKTNIIHPLFFIFAAIHLISYIIISEIKLMQHSRNIKNNFSFTKRLNLNWLKYILVIFIILWLLYTIRIFYRTNLIWTMSALMTLFTIYIVGYFGHNQPDIFQGLASEALPGFDKEGKKKYASSSLTEKELVDYLENIRNLMDNEEVFLQNDLKLGDVAVKINLPAYYVSQVINEKLGKNFYDFINEYRVKEVKKRLADKKHDHLTILAIGFDSGFNSKTAFYSAFKKNTGLTPAEFKKNLLTA